MYGIEVNDRVLALLRSRRIFHSYSGADRWRVGARLKVDPQARIEPYAQVWAGEVLPRALGAFSYSQSPFRPGMEVGRYGSIAQGLAIMGESHPHAWAATSPIFFVEPHGRRSPAAQAYEETRALPLRDYDAGAERLVVGHDVWIGEQVMVKRGVTIGDGAVVGARSLVLHDVPPYAIVHGQPARVSRYRVPEPLIARLLTLQWWRFEPADVARFPIEEPERFADLFEAALAREEFRPMQPVALTAQDLLAAAKGAGPA